MKIVPISIFLTCLLNLYAYDLIINCKLLDSAEVANSQLESRMLPTKMFVLIYSVLGTKCSHYLKIKTLKSEFPTDMKSQKT